MNQLAMRGSMHGRLRDAELRETELAVAIAHAEDSGSKVVAIEAIRHIYPSLTAQMQLQPDGTYEPVEPSTGPTWCPRDCGLPIGHEGDCYL